MTAGRLELVAFPEQEKEVGFKLLEDIFGSLLIEDGGELSPTRFLESAVFEHHRENLNSIQCATFHFKYGFILSAFRNNGGEFWTMEERCPKCLSGTRFVQAGVLECGGCSFVVAQAHGVRESAGHCGEGLTSDEASALQSALIGRLSDKAVDPLEAILASSEFLLAYEKLVLTSFNFLYWAQEDRLDSLGR